MTDAASPYPTLFTPIEVAGHTLPNRILMGSMHTCLEEAEGGMPRLAAFYAERARHGCALMVTGGFSPTREGRMMPGPGTFETEDQADAHRVIPEAVHGEGGRILLQLLHSGRYGYHPDIVAPSPIKSPINRDTPRELDEAGIEATIDAYARSAALAEKAGYDGVEIMGSEGYLISQFVALHTNKREDRWGGSFENRIRFAVEVVRRTRAAVSPGFIVMYRISVLDGIEGGLSSDEIVAFAKAIEAAGADIINSGIGWHEARFPTITQAVPRGGWVWATERLMGAVSVPLIATNRINTPDKAEEILAARQADMVSMARPFLADPAFVEKAEAGRAGDINTCIACNQACLDQYFIDQPVSCLVNPRACRETELSWGPAAEPKKIAVVGAGPAGLAAATVAAERGHAVALFEAGDEIGGQFTLARRIPGKEEFDETLRYFRRRLDQLAVDVRLHTVADADALAAFDEIILATGVSPRVPDIEGIEHPMVMGYADLLSGRRQAGERVAVIGAGGIGVDVALYLVEAGHRSHLDPAAFRATWGIGVDPKPAEPAHRVTLLQRSDGRMGSGPGKTTGWVHRMSLLRAGVEMIAGAAYQRIDDDGLHVTVKGEPRRVACDSVVICAGQDPLADLAPALAAMGKPVHPVGGARLAGELDAERAILEATRVAAVL